MDNDTKEKEHRLEENLKGTGVANDYLVVELGISKGNYI